MLMKHFDDKKTDNLLKNISIVLALLLICFFFSYSNAFSRKPIENIIAVDSDFKIEKPPKTPDIIVNMHIGKTGGSTMNKIITNHYTSPHERIIHCILEPEKFYPYQAIRKLDENFFYRINESRKKFVKYTGGHIGAEVLNCFGNTSNVKLFAIIREPFSLLISSFWYAKQREPSNIGTTCMLDEELIQYVQQVNYRNPQRPLKMIHFRP